MDDDRRRAILREIAALAPAQRTMEPYMFTVMDFAREKGWLRARTEDYLRCQVAQGKLRMDLNGYDPRTGRRAAVYWRPEDEANDSPQG